MRLLTRFAALITLLAPIAIVLFWSVTYVYACFDHLLSPGKPLDVSIPTRGGDLRVKAERYSISLWQGAVIAEKARIYEPDGSLLAGAEKLTLTMAGSDQGWDGPVNVRLRGVQAVLKRDTDRSFPAMRYLPESTDEPSTTPFVVDIEGALLTVEDEADGGLLTGVYEVGKARIEGIGDSWLGSLDMSRKDAGGRILASIRQDPEKGLTLDAELRNAEAADIARKLRSLEEMKDAEWTRQIDAESLIVSGTAKLTFPAEGSWSMTSSLTAQGRNIRYGSDWRAQQAMFVGQVRESGAAGKLEATVGSQPVRLDAQMDWSEEFRLVGTTSVRVASKRQLPEPIRKLLPEDTDFADASYDGWIAYHGEKGASLSGDVKAASLTWQEEVVRSPRLHVGYADGKLLADVQGGSAFGGVAKGAIQFEEKTKRLTGEIAVEGIHLATVGKRYLDRRATGEAKATVLLGGTIDEPRIELRAHGRGSVALADSKLSPEANVEFGGLFTEEGLDIRRLKVYHGDTAAMLTGRWDIKDGSLSIDGSVRRLLLEDWIENASGTANAELTIEGTASEPKLSGFAEVYAAKVYDYHLPFASGDFTVLRDRVLASDLLLTRGASKVRGEVQYAFGEGTLDGKLSGESIQLAEWGPEGISGLLDFADAKVSGTLEQPKVDAKLTGESILIHGVLLDSGEADVALNGKVLDVHALSLRGDAGAATGKGFYSFETQSGQFEADCDKVILAQVLPELPEKTQIDGTLRQVHAVAEIREGKLQKASAEGAVNALSINQTPLGQGQWSAKMDGDDYTASAFIGQIDAYIEANELKYNISSKETAGEVFIKGFPARDIYLLARPYMTVRSGQTEPPKFDAPPELIEQLDRFQGTLNAGFTLSGTLDSIGIECPDLTLEKMDLGGTYAGELAAAFTRKSQVWQIEKFAWKGGPGTLSVTGSVDEHGEMDLDGEVKNFKPSWIASAIPDFPSVPGEATVSFIANGPTKSPTIHASLDAEIVSGRQASSALAGEENTVAPKTEAQTPLGLVLDTIEIEQGSIKAQGRLNYGGFQGRIDANVPFEYPLTIPEDRPISAKLDFGKRSLTELKELIPALDERRTDGEAAASLTVTGTKADLIVNGTVQLNAKTLAFTEVQTHLTDVEASATIDEDSIEVTALGKSSRMRSGQEPGQVAVRAVAGLQKLIESLSGSPDLNAVPIDASVQFTRFMVSEDLQERIGGQTEQRLKGEGVLDGRILANGTVGALSIYTEEPLVLSNVGGTFYSAFEGGTYEEPKPNAPRLAIDFVAGTASNPADVSVANAAFALYGRGRIEGTTDQPNATANMTLSSGVIRLPNARVTMDEGGALRFLYRSGRPDQAETRLDVDLTGHTSLSARGSTGLVERYEVRIGVTGNLLEQEGQRIVATSEPSDLSQQKILALLGQSQIFEGLDPTANTQQLQRQLQEALAGVALPVVFDAVTGELARSLGLDYLNFEYNGYEGPVVAFAKSLTRNLTIQGRRQLQQRTDEKLRFDLSLVYRPFRQRGSFRNISFTAGLDQDRPYKIGIEYTIRF